MQIQVLTIGATAVQVTFDDVASLGAKLLGRAANSGSTYLGTTAAVTTATGVRVRSNHRRGVPMTAAADFGPPFADFLWAGRHRSGGGGGATLVSATVDTTGTTITLVFNQAVTGATGASFSMVNAGNPQTLEYASGDGTATVVLNNPDDQILAGSVVTINYSGGAIPGLADFSGFPAVNNSQA